MAKRKDIEKYCECMEGINVRLSAIDCIISGSANLGNTEHDIELICVHLRKALELIAFSSMIANKDAYSRIYNDFSNHWNAKKMLKHLSDINPDFYPVPLFLAEVRSDGSKHFDYVKSGFLTKDNFLSLYEKCSGSLHTKNPYSLKKSSPLKKSEAKKWVSTIRKLLSLHRARFFEGEHGWLVTMGYETDDKVRGFPFEAKNQ